MAEPAKYQGVIPDDLEDLKNVDHSPSPQVGDLLAVTAVDANGRVHWKAVTGGGGSGSGPILDAQIPASIARDTEVAAAVSSHVAATDPHADRAYTDTRIAALVDSAPGVLNTLSEIAAALQSDESAAAALTTAVADKIPLAQKGTANGVATLDSGSLIPDAQIPSSIARDTEVAAAVAALVNSAPAVLDTLGEIATALQTDESTAAALASTVATKAPLASPTFTGVATAPTVAVSGLTGATTSSRYVGATTGGAPVAGTFAVNDWIVTPTGILVCIVAGSPGTWQPAGPGFELASDEATANETRTGAVANAPMNDPVTITFPCPASAFMVEGWAFQGSVATAGGRGQLTLGNADFSAIYSIDTVTSTTAGDVDSLAVKVRLSAAKLGVNVGDAVTFSLFKKVFNSAQTFTITASAVTPIVLRAVTVL